MTVRLTVPLRNLTVNDAGGLVGDNGDCSATVFSSDCDAIANPGR